MSIENILSVSAAKSYKTDPAGVVSGVVEGIAFRARISEGQLEVSVNLRRLILPNFKISSAAGIQAIRWPIRISALW